MESWGVVERSCVELCVHTHMHVCCRARRICLRDPRDLYPTCPWMPVCCYVRSRPGPRCPSQRTRGQTRRTMDGRMDGWVDGGTGGRVDGWFGVGGWVDRWMGGWADAWMGGWVDGWMGGWMGGWVDGRMGRWTGRQKIRKKDRQIDR